jgi:hypothetical protein
LLHDQHLPASPILRRDVQQVGHDFSRNAAVGRDQTVSNIEKGNLKMPKYLTTEAKKFLAKILTRDPKKRPSLE